MVKINAKVQIRNDTAAHWAELDTQEKPIILLAGEIGVETDTGRWKIGNGTDNWNNLGYQVSGLPRGAVDPEAGPVIHDDLDGWINEFGAKVLRVEDIIDNLEATVAEGDEASVEKEVDEETGRITLHFFIPFTDVTAASISYDPQSTTYPEGSLGYALQHNFALQNGYYTDMTAGNAEQLISSGGVSDNTPYVFRTTGGSADVGNTVSENKIIGGTVAWNQLVENGIFESTSGWNGINGTTISASNNIVTITQPNSGVLGIFREIKATSINHKYYVTFDAQLLSELSDIRFGFGFTSNGATWTSSMGRNIYTVDSQNMKTYSAVITVAESITGTCYLTLRTSDNCTETVNIANVMCIDLTQMFGSDIADHIHSLEQAKTGDGVKWFRNLFPNPYYEYNAGTLTSVCTNAHETIGFNAFNLATNTAALLGGNAYQITGTYTSLAYSSGETITPDANGEFTPSVNGVLTVTGGDDTTCVHLTWSGYRNGDFEVFKKYSYDIDDIELRGIPKIDTNGKLYYDGDEYNADGTVTRKYGIVDLGTLDWQMNTVPRFKAALPNLSYNDDRTIRFNMLTPAYVTKSYTDHSRVDMSISALHAESLGNVMGLFVRDTSCSNTGELTDKLSGVYLVYELAEPTTEYADPFTLNQQIDDFGTERYIDAYNSLDPSAEGYRDVSIPVGHESIYRANLRDKLQRLPDMPENDGTYIIDYDSEKKTSSLTPFSPETKADITGNYPNMVVGQADQLILNDGIYDQTPYNFRRTANNTDTSGFVQEKKIIGGTIVWNQLVENGNFTSEAGWSASGGATFTVNNNIATIVKHGAFSGSGYIHQNVSWPVGHKLLLSVDYKTEVADTILRFFSNKSVYRIIRSTDTEWHNATLVAIATQETGQLNNMLWINQAATDAVITAQFRNFYAVDLTQMFGSDIADYIYSLEQSTAGEGVKWFRNLFPKPYYEYNAGELMSVKTSAHETIGFNLWDEEWEVGSYDTNTGAPVTISSRIRSKNAIKVFPNIVYYAKCSKAINILYYRSDNSFIRRVLFSGGNATFTTPNDCTLIRLGMIDDYGTTYNHDICVNFSGYRNGEYEPYVKHTYPVSPIELRGMLKLKENTHELYYDGDEYNADGTVIRRISIVHTSDCVVSKYTTSETDFRWRLAIPDTYPKIKSAGSNEIGNFQISTSALSLSSKNGVGVINTTYRIGISDHASGHQFVFALDPNIYTTKAEVEQWIIGHPFYIWYELDTPVTETADPFTLNQQIDDFGTEQYVDADFEANSRDIEMPVGHESLYQPNAADKLKNLPDMPTTAGQYLVSYDGAKASFISTSTIEGKIAALEAATNTTLPTSDGTYTLKATIVDGTPTISWVVES